MLTPQTHNSIVPFFLLHKKSQLHAIPGKTQSQPPQGKELPKRILVIDDEEMIADSLVGILNRHGYEAVACYEGQAAIQKVKEGCPDFVLSDVVMPKLNGVDTVLAIRKLCPRARILLFSGQANTVDILAQARARGYDFELLPKPIHPDKLLKKLELLGKSA